MALAWHTIGRSISDWAGEEERRSGAGLDGWLFLPARPPACLQYLLAVESHSLRDDDWWKRGALFVMLAFFIEWEYQMEL